MEHARRSLHVQGNQIRIPSHLPADSVASEALVSKAEVNLLGTKMKAAKVSAKAVAAKSVRTGTAAAVGGLVGGAVGLVAAATLALLTDPDEVR